MPHKIHWYSFLRHCFHHQMSKYQPAGNLLTMTREILFLQPIKSEIINLMMSLVDLDIQTFRFLNYEIKFFQDVLNVFFVWWSLIRNDGLQGAPGFRSIFQKLKSVEKYKIKPVHGEDMPCILDILPASAPLLLCSHYYLNHNDWTLN